MLSSLVIAFLPRSKHLLISWLQSPSAVILESKKIKSLMFPLFPPSICHEVMGPDAVILVFWMLILLLFYFFNWRLITLQYCGVFCLTLTWISHGCTCIPHPDRAFELWCWRCLRFPWIARRSNQSILKEISPAWIFIGRTDAETESPILWPHDVRNWLTGKDADAGKDWGQEERGITEDI